MNDITFFELILAVVLGGVVPAVATVASVRTSINSVLSRLDEMTRNIDKAHDRIDHHVVDFHARFKDRE